MTQRFESFTGAISQIYRCIQKLKAAEMTELGLKGSHVSCLFQLAQHPEGLTAAELCSLCDEDKAAVSRCLSQLLQRGLVCGNFPVNKRSYRTRLTLTDSGRELVEQIYQKVDAALVGGSTGLTQQQRENFYATMKLIINNLSRYIADREE